MKLSAEARDVLDRSMRQCGVTDEERARIEALVEWIPDDRVLLYKNVEFKINAGYLWAGDAMDAFETGSDRDGSSDENIFGSSARIRYKF